MWRLIAFALGLAGPATLAMAQTNLPVARTEIWDLALGANMDTQPTDFVDFACGNGGGPPSLPLGGWADFKRCKPEASGLREVYFRYDDERE